MSSSAPSSSAPPPPSIMSMVHSASGASCIEAYPWITVKVTVEVDANINAAIKFSAKADNMPAIDREFKTEYGDFLRTLDYVRYSDEHRYHFIPLSNYLRNPRQLAVDTEARYGRKIEFFGFPSEFLDCFKNPMSSVRRDAEECAMAMALDDALPDRLLSVLKPYQYEGVAFAVKHDGKCLIADDMGLGKTLQAIVVFRFYYEEMKAKNAPALVVCPSSLRVQWAKEFVKWLPDELDEARDILVVLKGADFKDEAVAGKRIIVVSYDLASRLKAKLYPINFGMAIFDESHMIKNFTAQRTQALLPIAQRTPRTLLLSGTPAFARPMELYTQIRALRPAMFTDRHRFGVRYCSAFVLPNKRSRYGKDIWVYNGSRNDVELHLILKQTLMIRRLKKNVLTQLPEKTREQVFIDVPMTQAIRKRVTQARQLLLAKQQVADAREAQLQSGETREQAVLRLAPALAKEDRDKTLFEVYAEMAKCKGAAVREYLKDFAEAHPDEKVLVFAHHRVLLDSIEETVKKECKVGSIRIDGSTNPKKRAELVERFQSDDKCKMAVLGITAAGVGLTLTAASVVVFAELHWTPAMLLQAEDRAHRIGQRNSVLVKYLVGKDTMEEDMWKMLAKKFDVISRLLDNDVKKDGLGATVVPNGTMGALAQPAAAKRQKTDASTK